MKLKRSDIALDSISYTDEVGDRVLYPDNIDGDLYTILEIDETDIYNTMYTICSEEDGSVIRVPFDDTIHVDSQIQLCQYQVDTYEDLSSIINDSRAFLKKFPI